jgi:hypothetical protein
VEWVSSLSDWKPTLVIVSDITHIDRYTAANDGLSGRDDHAGLLRNRGKTDLPRQTNIRLTDILINYYHFYSLRKYSNILYQAHHPIDGHNVESLQYSYAWPTPEQALNFLTP